MYYKNYNVYLNDDPRLRTLVLCLGRRFTEKHLKNPWFSTHFFQKLLQSFRVSNINSTTSLK